MRLADLGCEYLLEMGLRFQFLTSGHLDLSRKGGQHS